MSIDVRKAIEKNSYVTSVADLEKCGRRNVKVIKTSTIRELINQAVENVRRSGDTPGGKDEMVAETKEEFNRLLRDKQEGKQAVSKLEETNRAYKALITDLNARIKYQEDELDKVKATAEEAAAAADTSVLDARVAELELELEEARKGASRVEQLESELAQTQATSAQVESGLEKAKAEAARLIEVETALAEAQRQLGQSQVETTRVPELEAALAEATKQGERFERESAEQISRMNDVLLRQEKELEAARTFAVEAEENKMKVVSLTAELNTLRANQPATNSLLEELRQMREDRKALEDRNRDLETRAAAPAGAADTTKLEAMLESKMSMISSELSAKLANIKHGADGGTEPEDIKHAIQQIFSHDLDAEIDSNLGELEVKETKSAGIAGNLERLKNLGRKKE